MWKLICCWIWFVFAFVSDFVSEFIHIVWVSRLSLCVSVSQLLQVVPNKQRNNLSKKQNTLPTQTNLNKQAVAVDVIAGGSCGCVVVVSCHVLCNFKHVSCYLLYFMVSSLNVNVSWWYSVKVSCQYIYIYIYIYIKCHCI